LADALGIPVDWFYVGQAPTFATDAVDLIRLYASITDAQGRRRVMSVVRREAERCEASRQHFPLSGFGLG